MLGRIPVVGKFLAAMFSFAGPVAFGALGVEPIKQIVKFAPRLPLIGDQLASLPASVMYAGAGLVAAALIKRFGPMVMSSAMADKFATAVAAAAGGVAYYKWSTGQDTDTASEMGLLEVTGPLAGLTMGQRPIPGYSDAYAVMPMGSDFGNAYGGPIYGV